MRLSRARPFASASKRLFGLGRGSSTNARKRKIGLSPFSPYARHRLRQAMDRRGDYLRRLDSESVLMVAKLPLMNSKLRTTYGS